METIRIGQIIESNNFGKFEVLDIIGEDSSSRKATVKFLNTGHIHTFQARGYLSGGAVDYSVYPSEIKIGEIFRTSKSGNIEVISVQNTKNITVKFLDTGNTLVTKKHLILAGMLLDRTKYEAEQAERVRLEEQAREKKKRSENAVRKLLQIIERSIKEEQEKIRQLEKEAQKQKKTDVWLSTSHLDSYGNILKGRIITDQIGDQYEIVERVKYTDKQWVIRYLTSGNLYEVPEAMATKGKIVDKNIEGKEKLRRQILASKHYEKNREYLIQQAGEYQKNNLDKARVRNQNRRAKIKGGGGRATLEEINSLIKQQENKCANCYTAISEDNQHLDHIMPIALGGTGEISNLQWLCQPCNSIKSDRHPEEWEVYRKSEEFKRRREARLEREV